MIPPTSIDGTDITGATIDGTEVTEITVDGDTVFSAGPSFDLPVAYSNLVAWYPFDSAEYGGSNADDVTAILGGSGDDTAYDGTVNGASYQSSGGVTDINAGANSGAFDYDGSNDTIDIDDSLTMGGRTEFTLTFNFFWDGSTFAPIAINQGSGGGTSSTAVFDTPIVNGVMRFGVFDTSGDNFGNTSNIEFGVPSNTYTFAALVFDNGTATVFKGLNGSVTNEASGTGTSSTLQNGSDTIYFGSRQNSSLYFPGRIDDVRFYNTALTQSQLQQIHTNTQP